MPRPCGAKDAFKSKFKKKTEGLRPFLDVTVSKNGAPLWREAHVHVEMLKN